MPDTREIIRTTCPRDCFDTCGITVVKRNGIIAHVRGDPQHPVSRGKLCAKCSIGYNREWRDPQARLTRPLRRVGPKGEGRFEPISWEAALETIADRFKEIIAITGPQAIINTHYTGTISLLAFFFPMRFFHRLGATEVTPDTICLMAGVEALQYVYGTALDGFDPRTARDAACIVVWGANPSASGPHAHEHWLREAPGQVIVIDPVRTPTAQAADLHLQPFPGSDAAERGLAEGDDVLITNETGSLSLRLTLSEALPRGVALSHKGRWPKREETRANVNVLNPGHKTDMGESTCVHGVEIVITSLAQS